MDLTIRRTRASIVWCLVALILFTALDLWSKAWAVDHLSVKSPASGEICSFDERGRRISDRRDSGQPVVLIDNYLELRYAENCGAAFSMLATAPKWVRSGLFGAAAVVAIVALLWMFVTGNGGPLFAASVPLVASGALGNLVDRVRLGYVVDFIRFHIHDPSLSGSFVYAFEWPTFNIADSTITVGGVFLILDGFRKQPQAAADVESAKSAA